MVPHKFTSGSTNTEKHDTIQLQHAFYAQLNLIKFLINLLCLLTLKFFEANPTKPMYTYIYVIVLMCMYICIRNVTMKSKWAILRKFFLFINLDSR